MFGRQVIVCLRKHGVGGIKMVDSTDTEMILVRIKKTDKRLGIKKDEVYVAQSYSLDPSEKCTLLHRIPDMYDPLCNQYWEEVFVLGDFNPRKEWNK